MLPSSFARHALVAALLAFSPATALATDFGIGIAGGTTGGSIEAKVGVNDRIMLRGGYNYIEFSGDLETNGIDYDGDFELSNAGAFVDIAPFGNAFILSGGAYIGPKEADLVATPAGNVRIGGMEFTPAEVGSLFGSVEFNDFAPYVGIGYDSFLTASGNWSFSARAGVMFTGSADVELTSANGLLSQDPVLLAEIRDEVLQIEEDAEDYKYYPVLRVGVTRRF
ncbi:MAG: hypothetical protein WBF53_13820 [Litorimonas sp.]